MLYCEELDTALLNERVFGRHLYTPLVVHADIPNVGVPQANESWGLAQSIPN